MTNKCDKCCNLYNDIDENDDQYIIDRLEDIVEISTYLIKVLKHKKMKEDILDNIVKEEPTREFDSSKVEEFDVEEFIKFLKGLSVNKTYPSKGHIHSKDMPKMIYPYYYEWF